MCGIAGLFDTTGRERDPDFTATAQTMANAMPHRGPDARSAWGDQQAGIGFGHRRLSIVDLSPSGAQPMHSRDGRYVMTYNGEVYNFAEIRAELATRGHAFRGTSDTEVMLAAISEWGVTAAVQRFIGMFAFGLFDLQTRALYLVRDRLGVKPLYWTLSEGYLLFGSELRALFMHSAFRRKIDRDATSALLRYSYIPAPATIFRSTFKLPPATILTIRAGEQPVLETYWSLSQTISRSGTIAADMTQATEELNALMRESVRCRMIADVPIGAFLSGGTDSSAVVALMQSVSNRPVRTFTIGFSNPAYNEADRARAVANHLGTDHTEVMLDAKDAIELVGDVASWFDEPFADSSQLPTYLVSRMTREHVTVALSGDGGDELFAGYPKYSWLDQVWKYAGRMPDTMRKSIGRALEAAPERLVQRLASMAMESGRAERVGEKARRLGRALAADDFDTAAVMLAAVGITSDLVRDADCNVDPAILPHEITEGLDRVSRMQAQDIAGYLPDDILTKADRCSMAVSLEAREPLLDHRVVEYVWSLPPHIRQGGGKPKGLLRAVLEHHMPRTMHEGPKRGFSVPLADWLKGPLRGWAENLLTPAGLESDGLDAEKVRLIWQHHLEGTETNATGLWNVLMLRAWSERWLRA
jgi:asparagine synthase (glutamine-hydrolysing)